MEEPTKTKRAIALTLTERRRLCQQLSALLSAKPEIHFAFLYGSAAEEEQFHDLDVALVVDEEAIPPDRVLDYEFAVEKELTAAFPYPVDVRIVNRAPLAFRYQVTRGVLVCTQDPEASGHFIERTWDEYFDFLPVAARYLEELR